MTQVVKSEIAKKILIPLLVLSLLAAMVGVLTKTDFVRAEEAPQLPTFDIPALSAEHQASSLPNVIVVATGGTIAGKASNNDPTNFQSYAAGTYKMADMVAQLPGKNKIADVSTYQFGNKGSVAIVLEIFMIYRLR